QLLADELEGAFDEVSWAIDEAAVERLSALPPLTVEVLFYAAREAIRNAARYGRGSEADRPLHLRIAASAAPDLRLLIEDNGVGIQPASKEQGGSQQGVALHRALLAIVGGTLAVE